MKNIQIIDSADNCSYAIYEISDEAFARIFPDQGQDIEFIEDYLERSSSEEQEQVFSKFWEKKIEKKSVNGIQGTLFYGLKYKKPFYPNKKDDDMNNFNLELYLNS